MVAILITAGPTREYLDDVRFLGNASSGRMGCALAEAALALGHDATMVLGPVEVTPPAGATVLPVVSALDMLAAADGALERHQIVIAAAAVADWRPARRQAGKPARQPGAMTLELVPNPDVVATLAARPGSRVVVGFALESVSAGMAAAVARGRRKLHDKRLDLCVVNLHDAIGSDAGEFVLCHGDGRDEALPRCDKASAAARIVAAAVDLWRARAPGGV
ncbi:MAG: phosphopantothenoylcysteine decarboxylase [Planctomycetes bacterium]|nr:phosphopantothenoylcysteine decarboxylase [Planctomycetota bacterium]